MIALTLEHGLVMQAPDYQLEVFALFDHWINHSPFPGSIENTIQLNVLSVGEVEEECE